MTLITCSISLSPPPAHLDTEQGREKNEKATLRPPKQSVLRLLTHMPVNHLYAMTHLEEGSYETCSLWQRVPEKHSLCLFLI